MRLLRFFIDDTRLNKRLIIKDKPLLHQWLRVLRLGKDQRVVLFNDSKQEAVYKFVRIEAAQVELNKVEDLRPIYTKTNITLAWSILKKDKNELVVQKATELGVTGLSPVLADRSVKTGLNLERLKRVAVEAAEQCGRSDIPKINEPIKLKLLVEQLASSSQILVAEGVDTNLRTINREALVGKSHLIILIGPEGGWSDEELSFFESLKNLAQINLSDLTLRAETAAITAIGLLQWLLREPS
jgi:16S rRNA (uracil1498-N3)-methyltransferase